MFYLKDLAFIPELKNKKPDVIGNSFEMTTDEIKTLLKPNTAVRFTSELEVVQNDLYKFSLRSDDGSQLYINDELVVDNDGDHGVEEKTGQIQLKKGSQKVEVLYFNGGGDGWLDVFFETGTKPKQILSVNNLKNSDL